MEARKDAYKTERQNILKLTEFAIKETINISLNESNLMENESFQVIQFLAILDNIYVHGIKRSRRQCWKYIMEFCKTQPDGINLIENIINIPQIKTNQGRVRAWIRLTLMQKTFSELFTKMIEEHYLLNQYYEHQAFLLNEEASIVSGLLISLNFTDFNFCLKEENLDDLNITIDVSRYMKLASLETFPVNLVTFGNNIKESDQDTISIDSKESNRMTDLLDQKNYLEEMNRHNMSTISDLKEKCRALNLELQNLRSEVSRLTLQGTQLETANSLLIANFENKSNGSFTNYWTPPSLKGTSLTREVRSVDGALSGNQGSDEEQPSTSVIFQGLGLSDKFFIEAASLGGDGGEDKENVLPDRSASQNAPRNRILRNESNSTDSLIGSKLEIITLSSTIDQLKQQLLEEKKFEHQYDTALRRNEEMEVSLKIFEKSERQKQEQVTDLKRQLDDLKAINSEMYTKIENYEASLKHKNDLVSRLETKNKSMGSTITQLEEKYEKLQNYHSSTEDIFGKMERELNKKDQIKMQLENDLKIEREMKVSLQHQIQKEKLDFAKRLKEISKAEDIFKNNEYLHKKNEELKKKCQEQEQALSEVGGQLEESKLETDDLKESVLPFVTHSKWQNDKTADDCLACHKMFSTIVRKHHCRNCGGIFCQDCSSFKNSLSFSSKPVRVCSSCHDFLNSKILRTEI